MKPYIVMIGSHPQKVVGGIATMIQTILTSSLTEEFAIEHIPSVVDGSKRQKWWTVTQALARFIARLATRRVALVYVHIGGDKSIYRKSAFIWLATLFGRKLLLHIHGGNTARYYYQQNWLCRWYLRATLRRGDRLVVVSEALQRELSGYLPEKEFHLLRNAVPVPASGQAAPRDGSVRVLYLGHFLKLKGIYDLVNAIPRICAAVPKAKFLLCGLHEIEQVRDLCQQRGVMSAIELLGPVPFEQRWDVLRRADIFVLPSYEEGLPVTVLEAMAVGLPVVTTPVGGIPQVVEDGVGGFFIKPGDVDALVTRVIQLTRDATLRQRMGQANRARIAQEFDVGAYIEKLAGHLRSLTSRTPSEEQTSRHTGPAFARVAPQEVVSPSLPTKRR
ncbi:MAG: glycosyltransferase family 4 protein [Acidobacteriota bacterium]|nr:glycosyltransferase family 4 protein [Blastocatellia bacterium]MDW8238441.1 glycosyltransferase family 4 protein [Acidobacteriota bacterium]